MQNNYGKKRKKMAGRQWPRPDPESNRDFLFASTTRLADAHRVLSGLLPLNLNLDLAGVKSC
jgi:hypothetical protein